ATARRGTAGPCRPRRPGTAAGPGRAGWTTAPDPVISAPLAPVAQGIERSPPERKVAGSNPAGRVGECPAIRRLRPAAGAMRFAMVGKGGAGKSLIGATVARLLARRGHRVLALDSDHVPGLSFSLGAEVPAEPPLKAAVELGPAQRLRWVHGVGAVRAA